MKFCFRFSVTIPGKHDLYLQNIDWKHLRGICKSGPLSYPVSILPVNMV